MPSTSLTQIVTSAVVAALVAILVELIPKPYLEARKDRIVQRSRARYEASKSLVGLRHTLFTACVRAPTEGYHDLPGHIERLNEAFTRVAATSSIDYSFMPRSIRRVLDGDLVVAEFCLGILRAAYYELEKSGKTSTDPEVAKNYKAGSHRVLQGMRDLMEIPTSYLVTPRWNILRRWKIRMKARERYRQVMTRPVARSEGRKPSDDTLNFRDPYDEDT